MKNPIINSVSLVETITENNGFISSIELAKVCGQRHSDFNKKAEKVLGEGVRKFSHTHINPQNHQEYIVLMLPEREACLMAMSYSYELQAQVFDAYTAYRKALMDIAAANTIEEVQEIVLSLKDKRMNHIIELNRQGKYIGKSVSLVLKESIDTPLQMIEDLRKISESLPVVKGGREKFWQNTYLTVERLRKEYRVNAKNFSTEIYHQYEQVLHYCTKRMKQVVKLNNSK
ncbi:hypothetical protein LDV99_004638 [Vibrio parahaemolyticus]|nr:hypothetical protein [Vibrio parahaemolyticus]